MLAVGSQHAEQGQEHLQKPDMLLQTAHCCPISLLWLQSIMQKMHHVFAHIALMAVVQHYFKRHMMPAHAADRKIYCQQTMTAHEYASLPYARPVRNTHVRQNQCTSSSQQRTLDSDMHFSMASICLWKLGTSTCSRVKVLSRASASS